MDSLNRLFVATAFSLSFALAAPHSLFAQSATSGSGSAPRLNLALSAPLSSGAVSSSQPSTPAASSSSLFEGQDTKAPVLLYDSIKPFSTAAISVNVGVAGIGGDLATPLSRRFNLRAGAAFFPYDVVVVENGINLNGSVRFASGAAHLDFFPWAGAFRISPGLTFYNDNHAFATAMVPGGDTFTLNDTTYTSSPTDPIHGSATLKLGRRVAPNLTLGFGNMIPRSGRHFSFPFELGVEFVGSPTVVLDLEGTSCDSMGNCGNVATDANTQANLKAEQKKLSDDLSPLQFYPILSIGFAYKF